MPLGSAKLASRVLLSAFVFALAGRGYGAAISAPGQSAAPGQTVLVPIALSAEGQRISGLQFDLTWDTALDVKVTIGNSVRASPKLLYARALGPRVCRYVLIGMEDGIIPAGDVLEMFVI